MKDHGKGHRKGHGAEKETESWGGRAIMTEPLTQVWETRHRLAEAPPLVSQVAEQKMGR